MLGLFGFGGGSSRRCFGFSCFCLGFTFSRDNLFRPPTGFGLSLLARLFRFFAGRRSFIAGISRCQLIKLVIIFYAFVIDLCVDVTDFVPGVVENYFFGGLYVIVKLVRSLLTGYGGTAF